MKIRLLVLVLFAFLASCQGVVVPDTLGGHTYLLYERSHGVQVEYLSSNGRAFLWYPGNSKIVPGRWKTEYDGKVICFSYSANSYNPVTGHRGSGWNCRIIFEFTDNARHICPGDPFRLASGKIPFVLEKGRGQLRQLEKSCS